MNPVVTENFMKVMEVAITQQTFTCSKSTIEAIEKDVTCSKFTKKTAKRRHQHCYGGFIVNFEHISHLF